MIYVFLGPSLALDLAKQILPQAIFLPPAKCGDVLQITRLKPKTIVLIDGHFETTAAIWHKEILFALEQGIHVWGGSSMGALRARELTAFGMRGVGDIVGQYFQDLNEDDAVAVLHGPAAEAYVMHSEARINMSYCLNVATSKNILEPGPANLLQEAIENTFYPERSWERIMDQVSAKTSFDFSEFNIWLDKYKQDYDLKKNDAVALLQMVGNHKDTIRSVKFKLSRSAFFRAQYKNMMCQPLSFEIPNLPLIEQVAIQTKKIEGLTQDLHRLARVLAAAFAIINGKPLGDAEKRFAQLQKAMTAIPLNEAHYLKYLLCITFSPEESINKNTFSAKFPLRWRVLTLTARLWHFIETKAKMRNLIPHQIAIQKFSEKFRLRKKLTTVEATLKWFRLWDLNHNSFAELMQVAARFHYIVMQNNLDSLGVIDTIENVCWFHDALHVSGAYTELLKVGVSSNGVN